VSEHLWLKFWFHNIVFLNQVDQRLLDACFFSVFLVPINKSRECLRGHSCLLILKHRYHTVILLLIGSQHRTWPQWRLQRYKRVKCGDRCAPAREMWYYAISYSTSSFRVTANSRLQMTFLDALLPDVPVVPFSLRALRIYKKQFLPSAFINTASLPATKITTGLPTIVSSTHNSVYR
jgi:hypothetical protein